MAFKRNLASILLVGVMALAGCNKLDVDKSTSQNDEINPKVRIQVKQKIDKIMNSQKEAFGIKYFGHPNIVLKGCGYKGDREYYDFDTNTLTLFVPRFYVHFSPRTTEEIIKHGLGHFYADSLSERLRKSSWPSKKDIKTNYLGNRLIGEGIAEYFKRELDSNKDALKNISWPKTIEDFEGFNNRIFYDGGYHLVKPIIDKYGQEGMEYLITNPPEKENLVDLSNYQKKSLEILNNS